MSPPPFADCFKLLTGHAPFPWQAALYERFTQGDDDNIPAHADLPTGLGKTSVIAVWLIALATHPARVPRRLAYVVNRRTVVDQTTVEVNNLRKNLAAAGLDGALRRLCALPVDGSPLAVSMLRGASADNREWSADPCRPAVIVGTVDLIGSRLLFSGYRAGYKTRPLFAGLLGQDTLIVHDEAHLEPAFQSLLTAIEQEQRRDPESLECDARPVTIMQLSATTRDGETGFGLTDADLANPEVAARLNARKRLAPHPLDDPKRLPDTLADLALRHKDSGAAVLVFARNVQTVEKVVDRLEKSKCMVRALTGTMRGYERNLLVEQPVFQRFLPPSERGSDAAAGTVYLVCTSAGEVGVNLSADHLVCDLTTFESMAQRFGRVNRFGQCPDTQVDMVYPLKFEEDGTPEEATLALLRSLGGEVNPAALRSLPAAERRAAFSTHLEPLPTGSILFDAWSLTSIREPLPGRPPVAPYLHGPEDGKPPETQVAWREEVGLLADGKNPLIGTLRPGNSKRCSTTTRSNHWNGCKPLPTVSAKRWENWRNAYRMNPCGW